MSEETKTKVIFRRYKDDGDIVALFPELPGNQNPWTCSAYVHVGQHGTADPMCVIPVTTLAKPEEYADLKAELEAAPFSYDLEVVSRMSASMVRKRKYALQESQEAKT